MRNMHGGMRFMHLRATRISLLNYAGLGINIVHVGFAGVSSC